MKGLFKMIKHGDVHVVHDKCELPKAVFEFSGGDVDLKCSDVAFMRDSIFEMCNDLELCYKTIENLRTLVVHRKRGLNSILCDDMDLVLQKLVDGLQVTRRICDKIFKFKPMEESDGK
jgi:hypothetical protein